MGMIDKQELLDWIQNCWDWATVDGITSTTVLKQTMTDISQLPTVEAIPKDQYEARLKADMVTMLEDLKQDFIAESYGIEMDCTDYVVNVADLDKVVQQKIDALKADKE